MEETDKSELAILGEYIRAELELIGCKYISLLTVPDEEMLGRTKYSIHALQLDFTKDDNRYVVEVTKRIDQNWNDQLHVKVQLTRIFNDGEMIPLSSLSVRDTLTVTKQTEEGTVLRLMHRVYGSITYKTPCDINTAAELVTHIFEISKL